MKGLSFLFEFHTVLNYHFLNDLGPFGHQLVAWGKQMNAFFLFLGNSILNLIQRQFTQNLIFSFRGLLSNDCKHFVELLSFISKHVEVLLVRSHVSIIAAENAIFLLNLIRSETIFYLLYL